MDHAVILCTVPSIETGNAITDSLVGKKIAACASILPGLQSTYRWKGEICRDPELLLIIKSRADLFDAIEAEIKKIHPYEVPEIIMLPITAGHAPYLDWIRENTGG